ncbi:MAG: homocysteine S-methyltransferase family protein [Ignavibacteriales bacterium]|nr:homocysteine S-methyltransferase family protein [Ignavibacteriales bacterium]
MDKSRIDIIKKQKSINRSLILDGANGSLLKQATKFEDNILWSSILNITNPQKVIALHKEYIVSGADIITTNTFRTNPTAYRHSNINLSNEEFVRRSVQLATDARNGKEIIIAGSNPPAEDCYQIERTITKYDFEYNHKKHIELLWENGVDVIWNETQSQWDEIEIISKFCSSNSIPFVLNFFFTSEFNLLSGEPLTEAINMVEDYSPVSIGFNCIKPELFFKYSENNVFPKSWGFYLNCGAGSVEDKNISCGIEPKDYIKVIKPFLDSNPLFVGTCCGSNTNHTKAIKEYFNEVYRN